jgi:hypothetical protein
MATSSDKSQRSYSVWRSIASGAIGLALGWLLFMVISTGIGMLWPEYREAMRVMFQERQYQALTTSMLLTNLCLFTVAGIVVGYVSTVLAKSRIPAIVVAALLLIYAVIDHYVLLWDKLPHWYNLVVPLVIAGFVSLGSHINSFRSAKTDSKKIVTAAC